jgi:hypothetical protein
MFARELARAVDRDRRVAGGRRPDDFDAAFRDHEERDHLVADVKEDVARGDAPDASVAGDARGVARAEQGE